MHLFIQQTTFHVAEDRQSNLMVPGRFDLVLRSPFPSSYLSGLPRNSLLIHPEPEEFDALFNHAFTRVSWAPQHITLLVPNKRKVRKYMKHMGTRKIQITSAGGGLVEKKDEWLLIHRLGKWDLPKGKRHSKEGIRACAKREVEEECGLSVGVHEKIATTYHGYISGGGRYAWKKTTWFLMSSQDEEHMKPQIEEGIDQVSWFSRDEAIRRIEEKGYPSIRHVLFKRLFQGIG
ncbi:MAG: NUDIX domain-containing protein [Cytophagales bacterium]|nr:NUDIX domain-containing protein [Cytophagales bacterium]